MLLKNGEDVRQDQLAVHMVSLMDRQLKEAGLDLRLRVSNDSFNDDVELSGEDPALPNQGGRRWPIADEGGVFICSLP